MQQYRQWRSLLLILFLSCHFNIILQAQQKINPKKEIQKAEYLIEKGMPALAVQPYINATLNENKNAALLYKAGQLILQTEHPELAIGLFKKVINLDFSQFPNARLYLGISLLQAGQASEALNELTVFKSNISTNDSIRELNERYIKQCNTAIRLSSWKSPQSLGLMARPEGAMQILSPSLDCDNNFIFATEFQLWSGEKDDAPRLGSALFSALNPEHIEHPFDFPATVNKPEQPSNDACISPDGNWLYFSRPTLSDNGKVIYQIYFSHKEGIAWTEAVAMNELVNEKNYSSKNPFVYVEEERMHLLFCTNKPDGAGGFDIWEARLGNDGQAILSDDLGSTINSAFDEITPFFEPSMEVLYFSCNGNENMGGFDIFRSERALKGWTIPGNIGVPYNSCANDLYYRCFGEKGFLQSDRNYAGKDTEVLVNRIYTFTDQPFVANVCVKGMNRNLNNYTLSLSEMTKEGWNEVSRKEVLLNNSAASCARTAIKLRPENQFTLTASAANYIPVSKSLSTVDNSVHKSDIDIVLTPEVMMDGKVYFLRSDSSWDRAARGIIKLYRHQIGQPDSFLFDKVMAANGKYAFTLPAGKHYRLNISASGYFPMDTIISTQGFEQPGGMVYDFRLSQEIFGKENYIDSLKLSGDKIVLTPFFKARFSAAIARMQNFIDEGKQVIVYCSRLPGHVEEAPKLPAVIEEYLKEQMGESWHAVWMEDAPKTIGPRVFKFYWMVSRD